MRLHRLEIQAFGPFATTAAVDFDELSDAGLFLLSGATGAGKTSVLDAVCFALYGDVPGDRSTAKRLRADQADPDLPPRVTLEATLAGRRFRLVRSPAWERPKRRGTGTTVQQAAVTVSEHVGGSWRPLSSRIDETGDLVGRLLGMNLTQFTQVAMLPQGRFQAFLRARSDDRHRLLQQLFRTGRFEATERWLRDHRLDLTRADATEHQRVADLVSRASETADVSLPAHWDLHDLAPLADADELCGWVTGLLSEARDARTRSSDEADSAGRAESQARARLDDARAEAERRRRAVEAGARLAALAARADAHADDVARLDAARRAAPVLPLHRLASTGAATLQTAEALAAHSLDRVEVLAGRAVPAGALDAAVEEAVADAASARASRPGAEALTRATERHAGLRRHHQRVRGDLERLAAERERLPDRLAAERTAVHDLRAGAARVESLTVAAQDCRARLDAHHEAAELGDRLESARAEWLAAREHTLDLKEHLVTVQLARLDGMAAELAGALAVGGSCPVCGSAEHPHKADPAPGAPDAATEREARATLDDATAVEHARDHAVRDLEQNLAAARARAGETSPDALASRLADLQEALGEAHRAAGLLPEAETGLTTLENELGDLDRHSAVLTSEAERTADQLGELDAELADLQADLDAVLGDWPDLDSLVRHHDELATACREAARRHDEADRAREAHRQAEDAVHAGVAEAGFVTVDAAVSAGLDPDPLDRLARAVADHVRQVESATQVLREAGDADPAAPLPDLDGLAAAHREALDALGAARAAVALWTARGERLTGLLADLDAALTAWAPLRRDLALATRLSSFVEGKSPDNRLRMRLSAYVLAYRLGQVVAAANERLARMSDQRYSLEHTGRRGAGETRGGLSLLVRDDWSGEARDPATLSGGETFVVSLALALGLADVIAHETGGAALDTLFVDEGFGSLDADTLDDVLDTLDSLRDGGRVVGVVSHVAEMRDRIPTQLLVTKSRRGSSVAVRR